MNFLVDRLFRDNGITNITLDYVRSLVIPRNTDDYKVALSTSLLFASREGERYIVDDVAVPYVQTRLDEGIIDVDIDESAALQNPTFRKAVRWLKNRNLFLFYNKVKKSQTYINVQVEKSNGKIETVKYNTQLAFHESRDDSFLIYFVDCLCKGDFRTVSNIEGEVANIYVLMEMVKEEEEESSKVEMPRIKKSSKRTEDIPKKKKSPKHDEQEEVTDDSDEQEDNKLPKHTSNDKKQKKKPSKSKDSDDSSDSEDDKQEKKKSSKSNEPKKKKSSKRDEQEEVTDDSDEQEKNKLSKHTSNDEEQKKESSKSKDSDDSSDSDEQEENKLSKHTSNDKEQKKESSKSKDSDNKQEKEKSLKVRDEPEENKGDILKAIVEEMLFIMERQPIHTIPYTQPSGFFDNEEKRLDLKSGKKPPTLKSLKNSECILYIPDIKHYDLRRIASFVLAFFNDAISATPHTIFTTRDIELLNLSNFTATEDMPISIWYIEFDSELLILRHTDNFKFEFNVLLDYATLQYKNNDPVNITFYIGNFERIKVPCLCVMFSPADSRDSIKLYEVAGEVAMLGIQPKSGQMPSRSFNDYIDIIYYEDIKKLPNYKEVHDYIKGISDQYDDMSNLSQYVINAFEPNFDGDSGIAKLEEAHWLCKHGKMRLEDINPSKYGILAKYEDLLDEFKHSKDSEDSSDDDEDSSDDSDEIDYDDYLFNWNNNPDELECFIQYYAFNEEQKPILKRMYEKICAYCKKFQIFDGGIPIPFSRDEKAVLLFDNDKFSMPTDAHENVIINEIYEYQALIPKDMIIRYADIDDDVS